ncbi:hypothetical protein [Nonomuraea dietziae]|uniref:hypothetical protein n=1 Tax=Nonomuraea dietziae TaxID=65515 RepID=UPI0031E3C743
MPANSAYEKAAAALAMPAIRKEMRTAGPGRLVGDRSGQREDPGSDDAADADGGELPEAQRTRELTLVFRGDLADRFAAKNPRSTAK